MLEFCKQLLLLWDGWTWGNWGSLWADQVGKVLLTKLQPAVAASAGRQLSALSASAPFPSTSFLLDWFHHPFHSSSNVTLCPCCVLPMPVLLGAHHLLPASLGQPLWSGRGTEAAPAWSTLLQLLFSYWTLLRLARMFPWQNIPLFSGGEKEEPEGPSRDNWLCFGWDSWKTNFPLPSAICFVYQLTSSIHEQLVTLGNAGWNRH